eukprot:CAMPEP_0185279772 /NCGR_PEP_ID=MMETSP1359-20130426/64334_1 /TAXON_ID=552665 /ORGANISM="Bigelowiella longifila, Strain CCMP242" /LENGTH=137 /DNA_ID=CAMNT_0027874751 /DNA_START=211 /DNA_END=624 /DNA_ORIENTATION=-
MSGSKHWQHITTQRFLVGAADGDDAGDDADAKADNFSSRASSTWPSLACSWEHADGGHISLARSSPPCLSSDSRRDWRATNTERSLLIAAAGADDEEEGDEGSCGWEEGVKVKAEDRRSDTVLSSCLHTLCRGDVLL